MAGEYFSQRQDEILTEIADADMRGEEAHTEILKTKKQLILEWVDRCKKEVERGVNPDLPHETLISSYISKKMRETTRPDGKPVSEGAINYTQSIIPKEYKNPRLKNEAENGNGLVFKDSDGDGSMPTKKLIMPKLKPVAELTHADMLELAEVVKEAKEISRTIQDYGKQAQEKADAHGYVDVNIIKLKQESTPKDVPRVTKLSDAIQRGIDRLTRLKAKTIEFPPDMQEEEMYAQSVDGLFSIFDPMIDEKWSADWMSDKGWLEIQKYNTIHGKHAAAVKFGGQTINGTYRPLTREEVGDQYEVVVEKTRQFYNAIPGIASLCDWYLTYVRPRILARKENISDELSDKA